MVPLIVSAGAAQIFAAGIREAKELNDALRVSAGTVGLLATHAYMLVRAVRAFFYLHLLMTVALLLAMGLLLIYGEVPGLPATAPTNLDGRSQTLSRPTEDNLNHVQSLSVGIWGNRPYIGPNGGGGQDC